MELLRLEKVSFSIDGRMILRDVSCAIAAGEYVSIIGPNGAGKSTLVKCLCRIHTHHGGSIFVKSRPLSSIPCRELARLISYVPQADGRELPFNVHEFVMMGRYPHLSPFTSPQPEDVAAVDRAMALTGTTEFRDRPVMTLSGGERQKVFIAAALAQEAEIVLLDEPATFLDYRHQGDVMGMLRRLNREHRMTVIAVSHDINSAAAFSDRILALRGGETCYWGGATELLTPERLQDIFSTRFHLVHDPARPRPLVCAEGTV